MTLDYRGPGLVNYFKRSAYHCSHSRWMIAQKQIDDGCMIFRDYNVAIYFFSLLRCRYYLIDDWHCTDMQFHNYRHFLNGAIIADISIILARGGASARQSQHTRCDFT